MIIISIRNHEIIIKKKRKKKECFNMIYHPSITDNKIGVPPDETNKEFLLMFGMKYYFILIKLFFFPPPSLCTAKTDMITMNITIKVVNFDTLS